MKKICIAVIDDRVVVRMGHKFATRLVDDFVFAGEQGGGGYHCKKGEGPNNGFRTYALDRYEDKVILFYDGKRYGGCTLAKADWKDGSNPFRKPHFLIMNLALGGWGDPVYDVDTPEMREKKGPDGKVLRDEKGKPIKGPTGKIIPAAKFPMEMKVDWVRYYTK